MKNRLIKNYFTTILGVLILGFAGYMFSIDKLTTTEAEMVAGYGLILLRSKDSLIGIKEK